MLIKNVFFYFITITLLCHAVYASQSQQTFDLKFCCQQIQGSKPEQQDVLYISGESAPSDGFIAGVFDGHGKSGVAVAIKVKELFVNEFIKSSFQKSTPIDEVTHFLKDTFNTVNEILKNDCMDIANESGTTVLIVYRLGKLLLVANTGDSRGVWGLYFHNQTKDHTLYNPIERERCNYNEDIQFKDRALRVDGYLRLTRAFGNFFLNKKFMQKDAFIAEPEISVIDLEEHQTVIMGSKAVWKGITVVNDHLKWTFDNSIVYTMVQETLDEKSSIDIAAKRIMVESIFFTLNEISQDQMQTLLNDLKISKDDDLIEWSKINILGNDLAATEWIKRKIMILDENMLDVFIQKYKQFARNNTSLIIIHASPHVDRHWYDFIKISTQKVVYWSAVGFALFSLIGYGIWKYNNQLIIF